MRSSRSDTDSLSPDDPRGGLPADLASAIESARQRLAPLASRVLFFPTIGSTNDAATTAAWAAGGRGDRAPGPEGLVVIADQQTAGRGRRGRTWFSPPGSGLYVSVVLTPSRARVDPGRATLLLTLAAGVALAEAVEAATGLVVDLKWPNDLHAAGRKLAGILAEAAGGHVVLGYGINVAPMACPPELAGRATSLETELGRTVDRHRVLIETLAALARRYADLLEGRFDAILDDWRLRAPASLGARVGWTTPAGPRSGTTAGIDQAGALLVRTAGGIERIVAGELTWF